MKNTPEYNEYHIKKALFESVKSQIASFQESKKNIEDELVILKDIMQSSCEKNGHEYSSEVNADEQVRHENSEFVVYDTETGDGHWEDKITYTTKKQFKKTCSICGHEVIRKAEIKYV